MNTTVTRILEWVNLAGVEAKGPPGRRTLPPNVPVNRDFRDIDWLASVSSARAR